MRRIAILLGVLVLALVPLSASAEVGFVRSNIWTSKTAPVEGDAVTLYAIVVNSGNERLEGSAVFRDLTTTVTIGAPRTFGLDPNGTSSVLSVVWSAVRGDHRFQAQITDAETVSATGARRVVSDNILSESTEVIHVAVDSDDDGLTDEQEQQRGTNPQDSDSDDDGVPDGREVGQGTNPTNRDTDGDGDPDGRDPQPGNPGVRTPPDTDGDGIPDEKDSDDDNDGLYDFEEAKLGTNPVKRDTDGDGVDDKEDAFPLDPKRSKKTQDVQRETSDRTGEPVAADFSPPSVGGDVGGFSTVDDGDPFDSRTRSGQALKVAATAPVVAGERVSAESEGDIAGARVSAEERVMQYTIRNGMNAATLAAGIGGLLFIVLLLIALVRRRGGEESVRNE